MSEWDGDEEAKLVTTGEQDEVMTDTGNAMRWYAEQHQARATSR
jgi:hypothetical protein